MPTPPVSPQLRAKLVGNDHSGVVTTGTSPGNCVVTFNTAYSANVGCNVTARDGVVRVYSVATTALTINAVSASQKYDYTCADH